MPEKLCRFAFQSRKLGHATDMGPPRVLTSLTHTISSGSSKGSGCSRTPFTTEKIAVFAPIPSASVRIATSANVGLRASVRTP
jgi:hypothetical protein